MTRSKDLKRLPDPPEWNFDIDNFINPFVPHSQLYKLPRWLSHWLGYRQQPQDEVGNILVAFWACLGAFCGLIACSAVYEFSKDVHSLHPPVVFASLGAAAILDYNTIRSPLAQPRAVLLGHALALVTGVGLTKLFMLQSNYDSIRWIAGPLACGAASAVMTLTNTVHPPGGASALLAAVDPTVIAMGWWFVPATLLGSLLMLLVALVVNNIQRQYPVFWWTGKEVGRPKKSDEENHFVLRRLSTMSSRKGRASEALDLSMLGYTVALTPEFIILPQEFDLEEDEAIALSSLQRRLRTWTTHDRSTESPGSEDTEVEETKSEVIRIPSQINRNTEDPDVATVREGSGAS